MDDSYKNRIFSELNNCLTETSLPKGNKKNWKGQRSIRSWR